jgi:hypothetical protein
MRKQVIGLAAGLMAISTVVCATTISGPTPLSPEFDMINGQLSLVTQSSDHCWSEIITPIRFRRLGRRDLRGAGAFVC